MALNIQRFSIHDGPGIRTLIFLKGCPLNCLWCSNPESQSPHPELSVNLSSCVRCMKCVDQCPHEANQMINGQLVYVKENCTMCGVCARVCPTGSRRLHGKSMNVDEVMDEIRKDKPFYYNSGGGITISGGEAFLQPHFLLAILSAARKELIHSAIETCGYFRWGKTTCRILENADLVLYDLKLIDSEKHMKWTGKGNHLILENVKKVAKKVETVIRFPIISGINDSREDVDNMCRFISNIGAIREIHLIPYHALGEFKYSMLQRAYPKENFLTPGAERIQRIKGCFEAREIRTIIEN